MSGNTDQMKGRLKQAAGDLTGDEELESEGERDEATGKVKEKIDEAADKMEDAVDDVRRRLEG